MKLISHRGNTTGRVHELENTPGYIDLAISKGFDVEVDAWCVNGKLFLGHDKAETIVDIEFLLTRADKLWVHCKNIDALHNLVKHDELNVFFHDSDEVTLTSKRYLWTYPGRKVLFGDINDNRSVCVLPENYAITYISCFGICSDYIQNYKQ